MALDKPILIIAADLAAFRQAFKDYQFKHGDPVFYVMNEYDLLEHENPLVLFYGAYWVNRNYRAIMNHLVGMDYQRMDAIKNRVTGEDAAGLSANELIKTQIENGWASVQEVRDKLRGMAEHAEAAGMDIKDITEILGETNEREDK